MQTLLLLISRIADIVLPRVCSGCKKSGTLLCETCLQSTPRALQPAQSFVTAIFDYRNPAIRSVIWKFKYKNARVVASYFGGILYDEILGEISDDLHIKTGTTFLLVPIPLHKKRLRERGYNQSELLVREIAKYDTGKLFEFTSRALIRIHATAPQAKSQKRVARFENLSGAFTANISIVRSKHIILIDDVTTTGATLTEARKALMKAGARSVRAYAVAH